MKVTPREYQNLATKAAIKALMGSMMRALVVLATGLGKTLTAAFIAKSIRAKRILFLVHNNFILEHAMEEFRLVFDEKIKMALYNSMSKEGVKDAHIVFATWQTMGKNLKKWKRNHFDLVIVDEAHHTDAETYKPVVQYFTARKLGITATPDREDKADIRETFGKEVIDITLEEAIARGWLPRIEYHVVTDESLDEKALQKIASEIRESKKRFTMGEVNRRIFIKKRDAEIAKIINGYNEKAVVFCASIPHAERMSHWLSLAKTFHSKKGNGQKDSWEKNQAALSELKNGIIRRVCAVNAFNEGVNVPSVGLVAFCRATNVFTVFRQQLGRGLRPGKDKLVVLDFVGNLERVQLVLEMMNKISDLHEEYTSKRERDREGYNRKPFEVSGKGFEFTFSDRVVDLMDVLNHCSREFYPTWQEASAAAMRVGINDFHSYERLYKNDERLPSIPHRIYRDFPGWRIFTRGGQPRYKTWKEASNAVKKLKPKGKYNRGKEYKKMLDLDPRLPKDPSCYQDFPGWIVFFGESNPSKYKTWKEASKACKKIGITNSVQYLRRYKEDPRLPSMLNGFYIDFPGAKVFFRAKYATWKQAAIAARKIGIASTMEYKENYKKDPYLPSCPNTYYKGFPGWHIFFGKEK